MPQFSCLAEAECLKGGQTRQVSRVCQKKGTSKGNQRKEEKRNDGDVGVSIFVSELEISSSRNNILQTATSRRWVKIAWFVKVLLYQAPLVTDRVGERRRWREKKMLLSVRDKKVFPESAVGANLSPSLTFSSSSLALSLYLSFEVGASFLLLFLSALYLMQPPAPTKIAAITRAEIGDSVVFPVSRQSFSIRNQESIPVWGWSGEQGQEKESPSRLLHYCSTVKNLFFPPYFFRSSRVGINSTCDAKQLPAPRERQTFLLFTGNSEFSVTSNFLLSGSTLFPGRETFWQ